MRCEQVRQQLTAERDAERVRDGGPMDPFRMDPAARAHLERCDACASHAARDLWLRARLDEDPESAPGADFDARFMARLAAQRARKGVGAAIRTDGVARSGDAATGGGGLPLWERVRPWLSPRPRGWAFAMAMGLALAAALTMVVSKGPVGTPPGPTAQAPGQLEQAPQPDAEDRGDGETPFAKDLGLAMELELLEAMDALDDEGFVEAYASLDADARTLAELTDLAVLADLDGLSDLETGLGEALP